MNAYIDLIESNKANEESKIYTNYKLLMDLISSSHYSVQQILRRYLVFKLSIYLWTKTLRQKIPN